jgi:endonuclease/exonuclease/phosphatase family metal-dependent hydrolase
MMLRDRARRRAGWSLVATSLGLHAFTVVCHTRQPDAFAAFLTIPLWTWGLLGLALASTAFVFLRANLSLVLSTLWLVTILLGADEARVLTHLGTAQPDRQPPAAEPGRLALRIASLNCASFQHGNPGPDLAAWKPDIVLVQETDPHQLRLLNEDLYQGRGDYRGQGSCGVITRWRINREVRNPWYRDQQVTIRLPGDLLIEVVNVHLHSSPFDARLWNPDCWSSHRDARRVRRHELAIALGVLEETSPLSSRPTVVGGDFNAPAGDAVYRLLDPEFGDSFARSGRGWGNTFHRRLPLYRLDRIFATPNLAPLGVTTVTLPASDHRMVIADFTLPAP